MDISYRVIATGLVAGIAVNAVYAHEGVDTFSLRDVEQLVHFLPSAAPRNDTFSPTDVAVLDAPIVDRAKLSAESAMRRIADLGVNLTDKARMRAERALLSAGITEGDVSNYLALADKVLGANTFKSARIVVADDPRGFSSVTAILRLSMSNDDIFDLNSKLALLEVKSGFQPKPGFGVTFGRVLDGNIA